MSVDYIAQCDALVKTLEKLWKLYRKKDLPCKAMVLGELRACVYSWQSTNTLCLGIESGDWFDIYTAMERSCEDFVESVVKWATPMTKKILEERILVYEEDEL